MGDTYLFHKYLMDIHLPGTVQDFGDIKVGQWTRYFPVLLMVALKIHL